MPCFSESIPVGSSSLTGKRSKCQETNVPSSDGIRFPLSAVYWCSVYLRSHPKLQRKEKDLTEKSKIPQGQRGKER